MRNEIPSAPCPGSPNSCGPPARAVRDCRSRAGGGWPGPRALPVGLVHREDIATLPGLVDAHDVSGYGRGHHSLHIPAADVYPEASCSSPVPVTPLGRLDLDEKEVRFGTDQFYEVIKRRKPVSQEPGAKERLVPTGADPCHQQAEKPLAPLADITRCHGTLRLSPCRNPLNPTTRCRPRRYQGGRSADASAKSLPPSRPEGKRLH